MKRAVIFSQYPQYSCATSGSSFNAIYKYFKNRFAGVNLECSFTNKVICRKLPQGVKLSIIDRWPTNPLLTKTFADLIHTELLQISEKNRRDTIILFSAHSLPLKVFMQFI